MPLVFCGERRIFFAHVPKTGGTSFEAYLKARFGRLAFHDHGWENGALHRRSLVSSPQHVVGEDVDRLLPPDSLTLVLGLVRDPASRAISEYKYQFWTHNIPSPWRRRFARLGFSTWLAMALAAARRDPLFLDNHLRPQVEMLPRNAEIFPLEGGFAPLIARIDDTLGERAPHLSVGHDVRGPTPPRPVRPSRQDLELIAAFYREDYDRFGYLAPDLDEVPSDSSAFARHAIGRALAPLAVRFYRAGRM